MTDTLITKKRLIKEENRRIRCDNPDMPPPDNRATAIENRDPKTFVTITEALSAQVPQNKIAAQLGVSESTIKRVRHQYADQFPK
jgi:hypothetical protein